MSYLPKASNAAYPCVVGALRERLELESPVVSQVIDAAYNLIKPNAASIQEAAGQCTPEVQREYRMFCADYDGPHGEEEVRNSFASLMWSELHRVATLPELPPAPPYLLDANMRLVETLASIPAPPGSTASVPPAAAAAVVEKLRRNVQAAKSRLHVANLNAARAERERAELFGDPSRARKEVLETTARADDAARASEKYNLLQALRDAMETLYEHLEKAGADPCEGVLELALTQYVSDDDTAQTTTCSTEFVVYTTGEPHQERTDFKQVRYDSLTGRSIKERAWGSSGE